MMQVLWLVMRKVTYIGLGCALLGVAVAIGQWIAPPASLSYGVRFGLVLLALILFFGGLSVPIYGIFSSGEVKSSPIQKLQTNQLKLRFSKGVRPYYQVFPEHEQHLSKGPLYYGRVGVYNDSAKTIENVSVVLHAIMPDALGRHDLPLQFMHDTVRPFKKSISLPPRTERHVDVVAYFNAFMHDAHLQITHTVEGVAEDFGKVLVGCEYRIKIWATGDNVEPARKQFRIGVDKGEMYMEEIP